MDTKKKSLQKLTDTKGKFNSLLSRDRITLEDLEQLTSTETDQFMKVLTEKFNKLKGTERDEFYDKIEPITGECTKNQLWDNNHNQITWAISILIQDYGKMPTKNEIADKTGLSRQTIHKHLKDYKSHPQYIEYMEQFKFMSSKVLAKVFKYAVNGDIKAAKLYFEIIGVLNGSDSNDIFIQTQNNYIQINGTILSQENVKYMKPEKLNELEDLVKAALTPK